MGNFVFKLPDIGEGVVEGEVVQWHVSVGDSVSEDDPIVDVMTDKATVTIPSPKSGVVDSLSGGVGDMIAVGTTLLEISTGEEVSASEEEVEDVDDEPSDTTSTPSPAIRHLLPLRHLLPRRHLNQQPDEFLRVLQLGSVQERTTLICQP